jgi:hypothetical protein
LADQYQHPGPGVPAADIVDLRHVDRNAAHC